MPQSEPLRFESEPYASGKLTLNRRAEAVRMVSTNAMN